MALIYDDDEMVIEFPGDSDEILGTKALVRYASKFDALLTETNFKVLVELMGSSDIEGRPGLDLVMVLDVSGNMKNHGRMERMKFACKLVVKKLSPIDRISIIKFSKDAERLCPLRQMTPDAQCEIEVLITGLFTESTTNMTEALEEATKVLKDRRFTNGRQVAIMLISGGEPNPNDADGSQVCIENVPVYTFGLGEDTDHEAIHKIASKSNLGTFSTIPYAGNPNYSSNLSNALLTCLAGLLSVAVKDLTLTITPVKASSRILSVSAGRYQPDINTLEEPVTISFGNLYSGEIGNVLVDLFLEEVAMPKVTDVLQFAITYKDPIKEELYEGRPVNIDVRRTNSALLKENLEVMMEVARINICEKMKQAIVHMNANNFDSAQATITDAQKDLQNDDDIDKSDPKLKAVEAELAQFLKYLESNKNLCKAFALSSELSHALQRFSTRGDDPNELRLFFLTEVMNNFMGFIFESVAPMAPPPYRVYGGKNVGSCSGSRKPPSSLSYGKEKDKDGQGYTKDEK